MKSAASSGTAKRNRLLVMMAITFIVIWIPFAASPAQDDSRDAESKECLAGGDKNMRYFLIEPREGVKEPPDGHPLLLVLPGGGGGADFHPFVKRIARNALPGEFIVVQLVSKKWTPDQTIVWPTKKNKVEKMEFSTEEFAGTAIKDVEKEFKVDSERIFTLSWSSSGPAAYAISLEPKSRVSGSFVAMSVYKPGTLPSRKAARGKAFYIYHSKADTVCAFRFAEQALKDLEKNKARVELETYEGGHGWHGNVYGDIRKGIEWLEQNRKGAAKKKK
jgi:predicted esterase